MTTTKNEAHAISNARGQLESIKELYRNYKQAESDEDYTREDEIREQAQDEALSVEFRSGWTSNPEEMKPEEFKILLSWGGPACQIIGKIDYGSYEPIDIEIQYQDWGTPWTTLEISYHHDDYQALEWFCNCLYFWE